jgi:hypothetical protein
LKIHLDNYRVVFASVGLIGILIFASPIIFLLVKAPPGQTFSEIYLLGSNHTLRNIPFNINSGENYPLYLGVGNHLGSANYYKCFVKLIDGSEALPNTAIGVPSSSPTLYEYSTFLASEQSWEIPLIFAVKNVSFSNNVAYINSIGINEQNYLLNKSSLWDSNKSGYLFVLVVELWSFNNSSSSFEFNNRYVSLNLNITK